MTNLPKFRNKQLFDQAFTHRSYLNESKVKTQSNERMEFLGDSILSFVVSSYLYKSHAEFNEGILTNLRSMLVNTKNLGLWAKELGFGKLLKLSKGEKNSKGEENESLLADCFEAFIGALFIDQGIQKATEFIMETVLSGVEEIIRTKTFKDPKSLLQEHIQSQKLNSPIYKVLSEEGPAHARVFTVGVYVKEKAIGQGKGKSKQEAEEKAATEALEKLEK